MIAPNIKRGYEYELATHLRVEIWESFRAAARAITPDMSLPLLVRLLSAKLQARVSANARQGSKRDTTRDHTCSQIWPILPERRHLTLLEALAKRSDALGGERAIATRADTAELVVVQAARNKP